MWREDPADRRVEWRRAAEVGQAQVREVDHEREAYHLVRREAWLTAPGPVAKRKAEEEPEDALGRGACDAGDEQEAVLVVLDEGERQHAPHANPIDLRD